jgi:hypothetical protein
MKNDDEVYAYLRFSNNPDHLSELVREGKIYLNHYSTYIGDSDSKQYDQNELASMHYQAKDIKRMTIDGHDFKLESTFTTRVSQPEYTHLFCLCAISRDYLAIRSDAKVYCDKLWDDFGDYVVLVHKPIEFKKRIVKALDNLKCNYRIDFMEYIDPSSYSGPLGAFRKFDSYEYQQEVRVAIRLLHECETPQVILLGNIMDIASGPVHRGRCLNQCDPDNILI